MLPLTLVAVPTAHNKQLTKPSLLAKKPGEQAAQLLWPFWF
jgi:hypothetical protein